jgi:uncharacterized SAM-binding protein YcdF (DUF218 family)
MRLSFRFRRILPATIVLVLVLAATAVWQLGNWLSAPAGAPVKADIIVALGGDSGERVMLAARLYQSGYANRILLTGMEGGADATRMHYLNWRSQYLRDAGIPDSAILFDGQSANTYQEALNTSMLLTRMGWKGALVVSDPPHMRRLEKTFKPVFSKADLDLTLVATSAPGWDADRWWGDEKWAQFSLMEVIKLLHYAIKY